MRNRDWRSASLAAALCGCLAFVATGEVKKTTELQVKDIKLVVPTAWKQEEVTGQFRVAQFKINPAEGDKEAAELVITEFAGGGGGVDENLKRWNNQFTGKDRKVKVTKGKCSQGEYVFFDATGTYTPPPFAKKTAPVPGRRMLAVVLMVEEKGTYFLKLIGPEKTVTAAADDLRKSMGAKADYEKEYKTESSS
jgi:gluconolactonase